MTAAALDTWVTYDPESDLSSKFGASLVTRAKRRSVVDLGDNRFVVPGNSALGDCYDTYTVAFDGRLYHCSCRDHLGGQFRKVCSHALAVMLYRKTEHRMGGGRDTPAPPVAEEPDAQPSSSIPAPSDPMFGDPPLPEWVKAIRPHQWEAVTQIVAAFESGDQVVCLDAPTGSGKTLLAELVRRMLNVRALYVCSTKTLQDQAIADFPYARVLKGRANYPTHDHPERFDLDDWSTRLTAAECTKRKATLPACSACPEDSSGEALHCTNCHPWFHCPYEVAKQDALHAPLAILNTSYFLTEANAVGKFAGADLVIIDEADLLEGELMGQVEVRVGPRLAKRLDLDPPDKVTVEESWITWVGEQAIPVVSKALKKMRGDDPATIRQRISMERLSARLKQLEAGLGDGNWVYTGNDKGEISFRPIRVDALGPSMLWAHGKRFLLMSASLIDPVELMESLGYPA